MTEKAADHHSPFAELLKKQYHMLTDLAPDSCSSQNSHSWVIPPIKSIRHLDSELASTASI